MTFVQAVLPACKASLKDALHQTIVQSSHTGATVYALNTPPTRQSAVCYTKDCFDALTQPNYSQTRLPVQTGLLSAPCSASHQVPHMLHACCLRCGLRHGAVYASQSVHPQALKDCPQPTEAPAVATVATQQKDARSNHNTQQTSSDHCTPTTSRTCPGPYM